MKSRAGEIGAFERNFVGGGESFLHKGTNGRWRDVLTADELARYDAAVAKLFKRQRHSHGRGVARARKPRGRVAAGGVAILEAGAAFPAQARIGAEGPV